MTNLVTEASTHTTVGSIPLKRPIFNKPSWSKSQAHISGNDLFHRSNQTYVDVAAEAERQRKRKLARKARNRGRQVRDDEPAGKRQRVSESEDDLDDNSLSGDSSHHSQDEAIATSMKTIEAPTNNRAVSPSKPIHSPKSLLKRYEATVTTNKLHLDRNPEPRMASIIDVHENTLPDSIGDCTAREATTKTSKVLVEDDDVASDDEFPELARQAREKARHKGLEEDMMTANSDPSALLRVDDHQRYFMHQPTPLPPPPDPVLEILIISTLPNTEPLIVKRKLSQRLKDVRLAWADRQHLDQNITDNVFLVWRGKRIFDHTTCRSLGYRANLNGRVVSGKDITMDEEGRIHMEIMTREMFEASKRASINDIDEGGESSRGNRLLGEQDLEPQIKIVCKAKGCPDFKLIVKPSTMISKICNAFRSHNQIDTGQDVYLLFDGDKIAPEGKVGDTEICDMDTLDVMVK